MSDAQLMRYVHDELDEAERTQFEAEVAAVPDTAARLRVLQRRSARLSALLDAADPSEQDVEVSARRIRPVVDEAIVPFDGGRRDRRGGHGGRGWRDRTPLLRAAAGVVLLLGGVLLVEPARAWVIDQLRGAAEAIGLTGREAVVDPAGDPVDVQSPGSDVRVSFAWSSRTFDIAAGAAAGAIAISRGSDGIVTAEITGSSDGSIMVTPAGIRIEGTGDADAVHAVTLPPVVETVTVTRDGTVTAYRIPDDGTLRLPLR